MKNNPIIELRNPAIRVNGEIVTLEINVLNCSHDDIKICDNIFLGWWKGDSCVVNNGSEITNSNNFDVVQPGNNITIYGEANIGDYKGKITIEGSVIGVDPEIFQEIPVVTLVIP